MVSPRFDPTFNWGHVFIAGSSLVATTSFFVAMWVTLTKNDDEQRKMIEATQAAMQAADAIHDLKINDIQTGVTAISDFTGRLIRLETQQAGIERTLQRVESKLDNITP